MMSSKLGGLLGPGSINKLALCKCQSVGVSTLFSPPLPQKGSVLAAATLILGHTPCPDSQVFVSSPGAVPSRAGLHTGLCMGRAAIEAQPGLEQNTLLGSNFFCSFWDRRVIYCIFLLAFLFFLFIPSE